MEIVAILEMFGQSIDIPESTEKRIAMPVLFDERDCLHELFRFAIIDLEFCVDAREE